MILMIIGITLWGIWMFLIMLDIRRIEKRLDRLEWDVEIDSIVKSEDKESK